MWTGWCSTSFCQAKALLGRCPSDMNIKELTYDTYDTTAVEMLCRSSTFQPDGAFMTRTSGAGRRAGAAAGAGRGGRADADAAGDAAQRGDGPVL